MITQQPHFNAGETVRRGNDIYESQIRRQVEAQHLGRYIAIDIETSDYEIGDDYHATAHTMLKRISDAALAVLRIGYPTVGRLGGRAKVVTA